MSVSGRRVSSSERESSGEMTEKLGFSVVAATSVTRRFSTNDRRQEHVLLGLGEAVHLVHEQHRPLPAGEPAPRLVEDGAHLPDAGGHGGDLNEAGPALPGRRRRRWWSCRCPADPRGTPTSAPGGQPTQRGTGASRCACPTTSSSDRGRMRTASGSPGGRRRPGCRPRTARRPRRRGPPGRPARRRRGPRSRGQRTERAARRIGRGGRPDGRDFYSAPRYPQLPTVVIHP